MPRVYVSIGSNVDREENIRSAVRALRNRFGAVQLSSIYRSRAVGFDGDDFYNLVAAFDTKESLEAIHRALGDIEHAHGRKRTSERFSPRTLDIDILLYGDLIQHGDIDVPREELTRSSYILRPLAELAPDVSHPETGERFGQMWERHRTKQELVRIPLDFAD